MSTTTNPDFNHETEAVEVAKLFNQNFSGKTILITGVNQKGIGFATAEAFASQSPSCLIITGRTPSKIHESIGALKAQFPNVKYIGLKLDLSSQLAVRTAATEVLLWEEVPAIDIIVNSAGVMMLPERTLSEEGIEMHLATNHIGHFLFTCLIMPKLLKATETNEKGATRIVNVTSGSPSWAAMRWSDINFEKTNKDLPQAEQPPYEIHRAWGFSEPENASYLPLEGYNQSKVANVLFSIALNKRLFDRYGILSLAVHPGVILTELGRNMSSETLDAIAKMNESGVFSFKTLGGGAATSLVASLDPRLEPGATKEGKENYGVYLVDCQISDKTTKSAVSSDEAEKLWVLSEELVKEKFEWA